MIASQRVEGFNGSEDLYNSMARSLRETTASCALRVVYIWYANRSSTHNPVRIVVAL